jgi:NhaP-type Na+/H+ or K+/H+ antiporter
MATNTAQKLQHELNSLQGLSIINLVCSALALAFGVYFLMPNLISLATTQTVELNQIGLIILGGLAFAVAIRWLMSSAKIIDVTSKLTNSLKKHKKNKTLDDDALTGLIVNMTAAYRENKPTLKVMMTISKIAGVLFAVAASLALFTGLVGAFSGVPVWGIVAQIVDAAVSFGTAAACFIIPHYFKKYSQIWDSRLQQTAKVEIELQNQLGPE